MAQTDYSFIIPVFRSVDSLEPLFMGIKDLVSGTDQSFEVIYVDDNGGEPSWRKLLDLKKRFPEQIKIIKLARNFGQNGATLCGIHEAGGRVLLTLDDDLQVHPSELGKLIACYNETNGDVVYGTDGEKNKGFLKSIGSVMIKRIFSRAEGGSDLGSSIRLISPAIAAHLRNHSQDHLFINQVISWYTVDLKFVNVKRNPRFEGRSGYSMRNLLTIGIRLVFLYTVIPLRIMAMVCIFSALVSLALAGYYIYKRYVFGEGLGFLAVIVIAIALILASISVIGIYLSRIYSSRVRKPNYAIKLRL